MWADRILGSRTLFLFFFIVLIFYILSPPELAAAVEAAGVQVASVPPEPPQDNVSLLSTTKLASFQPSEEGEMRKTWNITLL